MGMLLPPVCDASAPLGRFTISPSSLMKTAVMMKKISRFSTKSSIGARSMPWLSSWRRWMWRRRRTSVDREVVGEQLGLALGPRLEVVHRVEPGDAHRQAGQRADHRVRDAAR